MNYGAGPAILGTLPSVVNGRTVRVPQPNKGVMKEVYEGKKRAVDQGSAVQRRLARFDSEKK